MQPLHLVLADPKSESVKLRVEAALLILALHVGRANGWGPRLGGLHILGLYFGVWSPLPSFWENMLQFFGRYATTSLNKKISRPLAGWLLTSVLGLGSSGRHNFGTQTDRSTAHVWSTAVSNSLQYLQNLINFGTENYAPHSPSVSIRLQNEDLRWQWWWQRAWGNTTKAMKPNWAEQPAQWTVVDSSNWLWLILCPHPDQIHMHCRLTSP